MKISKRAQLCGLSPMRKFHPFAVAAQKKGVKIYGLNIGQPDIATPAAYFDAVRNFSEPVLEYAPSPGIPSLISAVCGYYEKFGVSLSENDVLVTTGGSEALLILMMCILDPGDEVIVPEPFYPNYNTFVRAAGGVICPLETLPEEGYAYAEREKFEALITEKTKAILITNPGNPTGSVIDRAQMRMLVDVAKQHDLYLISDEVYREFIYGDKPMTTMLEFDDAADNVIVIDSISKRFSACGARIGVAVTRNGALIQELLKFCQSRLSVATLDQTAGAALYGIDSDYFTATRDEYRRRRDTVVRKLRAIPGVVCEEPGGAFYLMAALPVDDADKFQRWLLTDFSDHGETVMFAPGEGFYATPGKGHSEIRIAYVLNQTDLERAMDLLALGIQAYQTACM